MIVTGSIFTARTLIRTQKEKARIVGFVPTMGALHAGHLSLVLQAYQECDFVVVSIFVNQLQFGPKEDYRKYPRCLREDKRLLEKAGVDLLFYPHSKTMYAGDHSVYVNETVLSSVLCGKSRPGHFRGVCTIVTKLFNIIEPDIVYFGQKDYQQALIVKRLVRDLNYSITVRVLPIVRDNDNLALSSRNAYLSKQERQESRCLYESLSLARRLVAEGRRDTRAIIRSMQRFIHSKKSTKVDYIAIVDAASLMPVKKIKSRVLVAVAVFIGKTRLIDNIIIDGKR